METGIKTAQTEARLRIHPAAKALVFDCDGTLADTMPVHDRVWADTFQELGLDYPVEFFYARRGMSSERILTEYNQHFSRTLDVHAVGSRKKELVLGHLHEAPPIRPVVDLVFQAAGKLPMAVVSGGARACVMHTLKGLGIDHLFMEVITADDPIPTKPAPDKFLEAARRLGVAPEYCQVFEDGDAGIIGADAAGMLVTDVRPFI